MRRHLYLAVAAVLPGCAIPAHADVTISAAQTQNVTCSDGVCAPTAATAVLNVGDLEALLASGNVEVTTTGSGVQAGNIEVDAALDWSGTNTLALDAYDSIAASKPVSVAGAGGLTLTTNDGGSGGTLSFGPKGHVTFQNLSSALTINGTTYTLENSLPTLASAVLANPSGAYALANDYDASQHGTYANCPMDTTLNGTIEGLGNAISKLSIHAAKSKRGKHHFAAFLGGVGSMGVVENLRLKAIRYTGTAIGGLASGNSGYLLGDEVTGSIDSERDSVGGLVQVNYGTIVSSSANVRVRVGCCKTGEGLAGGLVAYNQETIELSHAGGDVSGPCCVGAGGLVAENEGTIAESYATGNVESEGGGLVGIDGDEGGTISNSYATGAVGGSGNGAGFLGKIGIGTTGTITDSYSTGAVSAGDGGFVCGNDALMFGNTYREAATGGTDYFSDDYWDTKTSGTHDGACGGNISGVTGLTTKQLQSGLPAGFDSSIWAEDPKINDGLPYLINNPPEKK